jgi:hypothetical protein
MTLQNTPFPQSIHMSQLAENTTVVIGGKPSTEEINTLFWPNIQTKWMQDFLESTTLWGEKYLDFSPQGTLHIKRIPQNMISIKGELFFQPALECCVCLEIYRQPLEAPCNVLFTPEQKHASHTNQCEDVEYSLDSPELEAYEYQYPILEWDMFLLDSLQLALPDYPKCEKCMQNKE